MSAELSSEVFDCGGQDVFEPENDNNDVTEATVTSLGEKRAEDQENKEAKQKQEEEEKRKREQVEYSEAWELCDKVFTDKETANPGLLSFFKIFDGTHEASDGTLINSSVFSQGRLPGGLPDWMKDGCTISHEANLNNAITPPDSEMYYQAYEEIVSEVTKNKQTQIAKFLSNREFLADAICDYYEQYNRPGLEDQFCPSRLAICGAAIAERAWLLAQNEYMRQLARTTKLTSELIDTQTQDEKLTENITTDKAVN